MNDFGAKRRVASVSEEHLPFEVEHVGGVPFCVLSPRQAVDWMVSAVREHLSVNVRLGNAWTVALAHDDPSYYDLLTEKGVNLPDGIPVVWFMNLGRRRVNQATQVRGPSFFKEVFKATASEDVRHFLLGGSSETLDALASRLKQDYPGCKIAGGYSPPFAPVDDNYIRNCSEHVRTSGADLVWIGLGTPKQDVVGTALAEELGLTTVNVGAAFDFVAGTLPEAPIWVQSSGFEWLYRLVCEPKRLWRRYGYGNLRFLWVAMNDRLGHHPASEHARECGPC